MVFVIIAIVAVVLLIPLVYELPNYVYNRKYASLHFLRWGTPFYIILFFIVLGVLLADGIVMIWLTTALTFKAVRLWLGIVTGGICLLYFVRLIPIYYDEQFDAKSKTKLRGSFVREMIAITVFVVSLAAVSVYWWSFCIDAAVALFLYVSRLRRYLNRRRKNDGAS